MGYDKKQFREIIRICLQKMGMHSPEAEEILIGTAAQESMLGTALMQFGGPACGAFQMEAATEQDLWINYLAYQPALRARITGVSDVTEPSSWSLKTNLAYQIAMARINYFRKPGPIPHDIQGQAEYWKQWWNTPLGKGTIEQYIKNYHKYVS